MLKLIEEIEDLTNAGVILSHMDRFDDLKGKVMKEAKLRTLERELDKHKTNHILHLLLSVVTGGVWLIGWVFVSAYNGSKRQEIERKIDLLI